MNVLCPADGADSQMMTQ